MNTSLIHSTQPKVIILSLIFLFERHGNVCPPLSGLMANQHLNHRQNPSAETASQAGRGDGGRVGSGGTAGLGKGRAAEVARGRPDGTAGHGLSGAELHATH